MCRSEESHPLSEAPTGIETGGEDAGDPLDPQTPQGPTRLVVDVYATQVSPGPDTVLLAARTEERYRTWAEIWFAVQLHLRRVVVSLSGTANESQAPRGNRDETRDMDAEGSQIRQLPAQNATWVQSAKGQAEEREKSRQTEVGTSLARSDFWSHGSGNLKRRLSALRLRGVEVELREVKPDVWALVLAMPASKQMVAQAAERVLRETGTNH